MVRITQDCKLFSKQIAGRAQEIETISFEQASLDVHPFLMSDEDMKLVSRENLLRLLY